MLASLTIAGAAGGPLFGALLDRSCRPDRLLAWTLAAYALGIVAVQAAVGQLPMPALAAIALLAGLFNPAVTGGWTAQLPRVVTGASWTAARPSTRSPSARPAWPARPSRRG